ncbi:hypothetical protein PVK06_019528 [Gossypium arboreum]|uniref:Uncharacterized protein n=1 Tax=Gossypium arboreum TaxID=29729 RepID=A0ABR0PK91_GOSAR|nr:hypothetical protein PVK06_019528 [Gossypium arboreum]
MLLLHSIIQVVAEGVGEVKPSEIESTIAEKETKELDEEIEKMKSIIIAAGRDNTAAVPPPSTKLMTDQD